MVKLRHGEGEAIKPVSNVTRIKFIGKGLSAKQKMQYKVVEESDSADEEPVVHAAQEPAPEQASATVHDSLIIP